MGEALQEVSRKFAVESCARVCKRKVVNLGPKGARFRPRPTCHAGIRRPGDGGNGPVQARCRGDKRQRAFPFEWHPRRLGRTSIPGSVFRRQTTPPLCFGKTPAALPLASEAEDAHTRCRGWRG